MPFNNGDSYYTQVRDTINGISLNTSGLAYPLTNAQLAIALNIDISLATTLNASRILVGNTGTCPLTVLCATKTSGTTEGDTYTFTITRTGDITSSFSGTWNVSSGGVNPAVIADFTGGFFPSGTFSFASGILTTTLSFTTTINYSLTVDPDKTFIFNLVPPTGMVISNLCSVLPTNIIQLQSINKYNHTIHFRADSNEETLNIARDTIANLKLYNTLLGTDISNTSQVLFDYLETGTLPQTNLSQTFNQLQTIVATRQRAFNLTCYLQNYSNSIFDESILFQYDFPEIVTNSGVFVYNANTGISLETLVGFNTKIDVLTFDFVNFSIEVLYNYSSNFTTYTLTTLTALNTAIDTAFISNSGYYTLHIVAKNIATTNITFTFNYV
jgi:hypothetical protein